MFNRNTIACGDVLDYLKQLPDNSVDCCVCSPPFFGLRDYGTGKWEGGDPFCKHNGLLESQLGSGKNSQTPDSQARSSRARQVGEHKICRKCGAVRIDQQIGLEDTPAAYIERLVLVFREVRRILKPTGTCWIEIGDSYWGGKGQSGHGGKDFQQMRSEQGLSFSSPEAHVGGKGKTRPTDKPSDVFKPKDLMMMPSRVAIALCDDGWILRSMAPWIKKNGMPESVEDRATSAHSYVFQLAKSRDYYFDQEAVRVQQSGNTHSRGNGSVQKVGAERAKIRSNASWNETVRAVEVEGGRNRRTTDNWYESLDELIALKTKGGVAVSEDTIGAFVINPEANSLAHFATFPRKLIEPMILAGCPEKCCAECGKPHERVFEPTGHVNKREPAHAPNSGPTKTDSTGWKPQNRATDKWQPTCDCDAGVVPGLVLDPFMGSGTSAVVARALGRDYIGVDLNSEYVKIAMERLRLPFEDHHIVQKETRLDDLPLFSTLEE